MRHGLYAIVDLDTLALRGRDPVLFARRVLAAGDLAALQLRAKSADPVALAALARDLAARCRAQGVPFFVNDHPDVALAAGADGVHVGTHDVPVHVVRRCAPGLRVGRSSHHDDDVGVGLDAGADYVAFGPVFGTKSKADHAPTTGLDALRAAVARCEALAVPAVAIGGIDVDNARSVREAGARAGAVIAALVVPDDDVTATARTLHHALGGS